MELGFLPDVQQIVSYLPERRQTLLFGATLPKGIVELSRSLVSNPERIEIGETTTADPVGEEVWPVIQEQKFDLLKALYEKLDIQSAIIFVRTRDRANMLSARMRAHNIQNEILHAERSMSERRAALESFRRGGVACLIATTRARGLDISGV
ncbi:MAG: DEAD/DEAH box helicase, partial [Candidatus Competibacteraceae bacterium]|nr:DEAD/DEAH box helicase [Candidatus Competibacteraceae bacterium]